MGDQVLKEHRADKRASWNCVWNTIEAMVFDTKSDAELMVTILHSTTNAFFVSPPNAVGIVKLNVKQDIIPLTVDLPDCPCAYPLLKDSSKVGLVKMTVRLLPASDGIVSKVMNAVT